MIYEQILEKIRKTALHFTLIDPDETTDPGNMAGEAYDRGTDAILVGGTVGVQGEVLDTAVKEIKENVRIPVILFPSDLSGLSPHADAVLFLSLLNSRNPYYISGVQALAAPIIARMGLEVISTAYLITEPGGETAAGWVGDARPLPVRKPQISAAYALAATYMGFKMIYLEAGSGARYPVDNRIVSSVRSVTNLPLMVGGGIRSPEVAAEKVLMGADIIVTGTAVENGADVEEFVRAVREARERRE